MTLQCDGSLVENLNTAVSARLFKLLFYDSLILTETNSCIPSEHSVGCKSQEAVQFSQFVNNQLEDDDDQQRLCVIYKSIYSS